MCRAREKEEQKAKKRAKEHAESEND